MITGKIKKYDEPVKYNSYRGGAFGGDYEDWNGMHVGMGGSCRTSAPSYSDQPRILEEAVDVARMLGFTLGARVKRRNGIDNLGTIIHIHQYFQQAWNYTTGELEPFKVQWDTKSATTGGAYDYGIQDIELVEPVKVVETTEKKDDFHEGILHLC